MRNMIQIQTLNAISPVYRDSLPEGEYDVRADAEHPQALLVRSANLHEMSVGDELLRIGRAGAGVNNIPLDKMAEKGVVVFNSPGANANAVKELILAGMLISSRKVIDAIEWAKTLKGQGAEVTKLVEKGNTIIVIEHNLDVIKCADYLIDMGPEGGRKGGQVLFTGTPEEMVKKKTKSYTAPFLKEELKK